jgi:hypothetical protein
MCYVREAGDSPLCLGEEPTSPWSTALQAMHYMSTWQIYVAVVHRPIPEPVFEAIDPTSLDCQSG